MSYAWDIVAASEGVLGARPGLSGVTIVVRERPFFDAERDTLPLLILTPETEQVLGETQGNVVEMGYPLQLTYVQAGNLQLEDRAAIQARLSVRQEARQALHQPTLAGVAAVQDAQYEPDPAYDVSAIDRALRVSRQRVIFRTSEPRSG